LLLAIVMVLGVGAAALWRMRPNRPPDAGADDAGGDESFES
jgi:hypothetical protein